jgi:hypothetical protein
MALDPSATSMYPTRHTSMALDLSMTNVVHTELVVDRIPVLADYSAE